MQLTPLQIDQIRQRARAAGYSDQEIAGAISRAMQQNAQTTVNQPQQQRTQFSQPNIQPIKPIATNSSQSAQQGSQGFIDQAGSFVSSFVKSLAEPFITTAQLAGEAGNVLTTPGLVKSAFGGQLTPEELQSVSQYQPKFIEERKIANQGETLKTGAKTVAGLASYAVPGAGKSVSAFGKTLTPALMGGYKGAAASGAITGALSALSKEGATTNDVVGGAVVGGSIGVATQAIGNMISWAVDKKGNLVRGSEKLKEGTRKIKQKASVYGAKAEQNINKTLDKYNFAGTADDQYAMLEPTIEGIEQKITKFIEKNPEISVSKKSIREAFLNKLENRILTADITKAQAKSEVDGYLKDLLKAANSANKSNINIASMRDLKKIINANYGTIYNKLQNGTALTPREQVVQAAWESLDDAISQSAPQIKALLTDESNLYKAARSLSAARSNPPTLRAMGTSVPAEISQVVRDKVSTGLEKTAEGLSKIPTDKGIPQTAQNAAIGGVVRSGINDQTQPIDQSAIDSTGTMTDSTDQPTSTQLTSNFDTQSPSYTQFAPTPTNPFGALSKRQVLAMALSQGATRADLEELGGIYDMLAGDQQMISQENMQIADGLRKEYFTRVKENNYLEAVTQYNKIATVPNTAAGDLSLIFAYMKMLDPTSTVRESEQDLAQNATSLPGQLQNYALKVAKGKRLNDSQRQEFINAANGIMQQYQNNQSAIDNLYLSLSQKYGVDSKIVGIGLYGQ